MQMRDMGQDQVLVSAMRDMIESEVQATVNNGTATELNGSRRRGSSSSLPQEVDGVEMLPVVQDDPRQSLRGQLR